MKILLLSTALLALFAGGAAAQVADSNESPEAKERVQYTLILPEEKTPETVKAEENNPFESSADSAQKDEGTSEENQVRDILLRLPAVGGASGAGGMRIMLGSMRLVPGAMVPPVLPDQQVALKVKSITPEGIELVWVEKKPSGLPPKVLMIPMDNAAKVRYRLPNQGTPSVGAPPVSNMGSIRRNGAPVLMPKAETTDEPVRAVAARLEAEVKRGLPAEVPRPRALVPEPAPTTAAARTNSAAPEPVAAPVPTTPPASSNVPEASVLRMLFGNHAPAGK